MRRLISATIAVSVMLPMAALARQTKTITGETKTVTATVEAIEQATRTLTLKGPEGNYVTLTVPVTATRFDSIKVGDTLTAPVLRESHPPVEAGRGEGRRYRRGESDAGRFRGATRRHGGDPADDYRDDHGDRSGGPVHHVLGTEQLEIHLAGRGQEALSKVKVGDRVDITWTQALLASVDDPKH